MTNSTDSTYRKAIIDDPDTTARLAQAGIYFGHGMLDKAEPLFRSIPKTFPKYHVAASGLFNVLWAKGKSQAKLEAMQLLDQFLEEADRTDSDVKQVVANFIKIKINLIQDGHWDIAENEK